MLKRRVLPLPDHAYPPDPWRLAEARFDERHCARAETIFAVANGFIGMRGTFEEGRPVHAPGTYVAGFHETWKILHAEEASGSRGPADDRQSPGRDGHQALRR